MQIRPGRNCFFSSQVIAPPLEGKTVDHLSWIWKDACSLMQQIQRVTVKDLCTRNLGACSFVQIILGRVICPGKQNKTISAMLRSMSCILLPGAII
ncbi:hypothetical protein M6B38_192900 [Iris pallida]|uniref:Uncharacterized protein n=1 Tax=Iris pallida TaxID=29817 RepID=A0AAX6ECX8_IRIPA|nr:hypothetical protein M6B38_192900 [Iris pallida]